MAQEFTIKSTAIEDKINQLLPSQGGFQPGVDFSASTMVIPVVDLTESAEGSTLRQDLQSAMSHDTMTTFDIVNTTTTIVNTTGYWRVFGGISLRSTSGTTSACSLAITDGVTSKKIFELNAVDALANQGQSNGTFDFIIKLGAGDSLTGTSANTAGDLIGNVRQLADINGNLVNP